MAVAEIAEANVKAVLVSHRFNPGHLSHLLASRKLFEELGYEAAYRMHAEFYRLSDPDTVSAPVATFGECLRLRENDLYVVLFPSFRAFAEILCLKAVSRCARVYVYHEPFSSLGAYRRAGHSLGATCRISLVAIINSLSARLSTKVVLPSRTAFERVRSASRRAVRYRQVNLFFDDERDSSHELICRRYVSYIGTIASDHAFDEFIGYVRRSIDDMRSDSAFEFLIATRSVIPPEFSDVVAKCAKSGRLRVVSGRPLSNDEINRYYASSLVVWNAYRASTQSGVLPKAYMFGTPVLVCESNTSEYFADGVNGALISAKYCHQEIRAAIETIMKNLDILSQNCRRDFVRLFYYRSAVRSLGDFVRGSS